MLISERDLLKAPDPQFNNAHNANNPQPPNTLPKGLHGKRKNLNGCNIASALSKQNSNLQSKVFHPNGTYESDPNVIPVSRNYFFIRANISTVGNGSHVPTIVR